MSPPMLNVSGSSFSSALSGLADGVKKVDADLAQAQGGPDAIAALAQSCAEQKVNDLASSAQTDVDSLSECSTVDRCGAPSAVERLTDDISRLSGGAGDSSALDSLATGIQSNCQQVTPAAPSNPCAALSTEGQRSQCETTRAANASTAGDSSAATARRCAQTVSRLRTKVNQISAAQRTASGLDAGAAR
jgi:hypothetical protein